MSQWGWRNTELEREQREQLRLQEVRTQAQALLDTCEQEIAAVRDPAVQQLVRAGLGKVRDELKQEAEQIKDKPDQSLKQIQATHQELMSVLTQAQAEANRWSQQQVAAKTRLESVRSQFAATRQAANEAGKKVLARVDAILSEAHVSQQQGRYQEVLNHCKEADRHMDQAVKANLDETVRRQVVTGLLSTLQAMGFVVQQPRLLDGQSQGGVVTLTGKLPSGKLARFEVQLDGKTSYDLDGYEGRTCAAEVEQIEKTLHEKFGIRMGPPQFTWKNPDKIDKTAHNLPSGTRSGTAR